MRLIVRRIKNTSRRFRRYLYNGFIRNGKLDKTPRTIIIEPTNRCSLACSCCPNGTNEVVRLKGSMSRETFDTILSHIDVPIEQFFFHLHGEPFMCKDLDYFVSKATSLHIKSSIYSNGYCIDYSLLDRVIAHHRIDISFSLDITDSTFYEHLRCPGTYDKALQSLKKINEVFLKNNKFFDIKILIDSRNAKELDKFTYQLFQDYSQIKKVVYSTLLVWPQQIAIEGHDASFLRHRHYCEQSSSCLSVFWDGRVSMCSYDINGDCVIGNLKENSYSELFHSPSANLFRKRHFMGNLQELLLCKHCMLPRCNHYSLSIGRHAMDKMDIDTRAHFFDPIYRFVYEK